MVVAENRPAGFVYFAEARGSGCVKIGWSRTNVKRRIRTLQTGCPYLIDLLVVIHGSRETESSLHKMFAERRTSPTSEWFGWSPELASYIFSLRDVR